MQFQDFFGKLFSLSVSRKNQNNESNFKNCSYIIKICRWASQLILDNILVTDQKKKKIQSYNFLHNGRRDIPWSDENNNLYFFHHLKVYPGKSAEILFLKWKYLLWNFLLFSSFEKNIGGRYLKNNTK